MTLHFIFVPLLLFRDNIILSEIYFIYFTRTLLQIIFRISVQHWTNQTQSKYAINYLSIDV